MEKVDLKKIADIIETSACFYPVFQGPMPHKWVSTSRYDPKQGYWSEVPKPRANLAVFEFGRVKFRCRPDREAVRRLAERLRQGPDYNINGFTLPKPYTGGGPIAAIKRAEKEGDTETALQLRALYEN